MKVRKNEKPDLSRPTQAQRREESSGRMLEAALRLIAKGGVRSLSLASIGTAAGCSRELPRYHYGSKDAFIEALIADCQHVWGAHLGRPVERGLSGAEAILALFDSLHDLFESVQLTRGRLLLIFELAGERSPRLRSKVNAMQASIQRQLVEIIEAGIASGELIPGLNPQAMASLLVGAYRGIGYQWVTDPKSIDMESVLKQLRNLFIHSLLRNGKY